MEENTLWVGTSKPQFNWYHGQKYNPSQDPTTVESNVIICRLEMLPWVLGPSWHVHQVTWGPGTHLQTIVRFSSIISKNGQKAENAAYQGLTIIGSVCTHVPSLTWHMDMGRHSLLCRVTSPVSCLATDQFVLNTALWQPGPDGTFLPVWCELLWVFGSTRFCVFVSRFSFPNSWVQRGYRVRLKYRFSCPERCPHYNILFPTTSLKFDWCMTPIGCYLLFESEGQYCHHLQICQVGSGKNCVFAGHWWLVTAKEKTVRVSC